MSEPKPLEALNVSRRYGRQWAVRQVSLALSPGSLTVVKGHNGAGKTTLLALLAGAIRPTDGKVLAFGHGFEEHPDKTEPRRWIGWIAHESFVYPELTGAENLNFFSRLYGLKPERSDISEMLARVGLERAALRPAGGYSRGMIQRLNLARVLLQDARVWLMDEPATGLDEAGRAFLLDMVRQGKDDGRAILLVTHDISLWTELADRNLRLERGRMVDSEEARISDD